MTLRQTLLSTAALALLSSPTATLADVTAQDVWTDWKSYMESFGYEVSASEATSGDTLTISDMSMMISLPDEEGAVSMDVGEMSFTNRGDGTVEIGLAEKLPISFKFTPEDNKTVEGVVDYINKGLSVIVSGDPTDMTYQYTAAALEMNVTSIIVDGTTLPLNAVNVLMEGLTGSANMKIGNMRAVDQDFNVASLSYNIDIPPIEGNTFKMVGAVAGMKFAGTGTYPMGGFDPQALSSMLKAGFAFDGTFTHQGGNTELTVNEGGKTTEGKSSTTSGALTVSMGEGHLRYKGAANGLKSFMVGGDLPLPIEINAQESSFNLAMPVTPGDEPQDFEFGVLLGGFTTSDMLWGMIDPTGQLPRDPATLNIDLAGKAKLLLDIFDPAQAEKMEAGETPGELHSLDVRALQLAIAGADLTGSGAFTFDNADMQTIPGMPRPEGAVELKLVGGNGLLDKLVAMGLLPEDQAMGARMMMGLFAVPGEGEDTLNSKIEINEQGHVLANGQRLR